MNKRGTLGLGILTAIFLLIVGFMILNFVKDEVTSARTNLNCSDAASISDGTKVLCLVIDSTVPYWIIIIFSVVIGGITSRLTL